MKRKLIILAICLLTVITVTGIAACTENTDRDPVKTDLNGATLSDNGGMAVKYGNYIYFINGYAGETAANAFGEVIRGSICRTTLKNGVPDYKSVEIIVPKNIYGEDTSYGGIYIVNDYIYYNTTSTDKDSNRDYKYDEGVLMRTKIDGSSSEVIKEFNDNDIALYAGDNSKYLAYVFDSYAYLLNTSTKESTLLSKSTYENPTTEEQTVVAYKFAGDYLVYTMYNYGDESNYSSDYLVWVCNLKTGKQTKILSSDIYNGNSDREVLYTTTIVNIEPTADGFTMFYSKKGNDNGKNDGYYSYTFSDSNLVYDATKEVRYTHETTVNAYTDFTKLGNGYTIAFNASLFDVFDADGSKVLNNENNKPLRLNFEKSVTLIDVIETDTEVYAYYLLDSKFYYIRLLDKEGNNLTVASTDAVSFFSGKYLSTYTTYDIIDNIIYYINDDMEDNAYYYKIPAFNEITNDTDKAAGKILGIISKKDMVTLLTKAEEEEEEEEE